MAETTPVAAPATLPSSKDIERASKFTREPFLAEGEDAATVLAPGTPHRRAFDAAMAEIEAGAKEPSVAWRRTYSLLLGLERLLSEDEPQLADGAVLSAHQVDALSGTLTALYAEAQRNGNGSGNGAVAEAEVVLAPVGIPGEEELDDEDEPDEPQDWDESGRRRRRGAARRGARGPARRQALLVRARHRRRQDRRRARLRRGLAHRRCPHPDPPPQPGRPVPRRAARPRLQGPDRARPAQGRTTAPTAP